MNADRIAELRKSCRQGECCTYGHGPCAACRELEELENAMKSDTAAQCEPTHRYPPECGTIQR